MVPLNSTRKIGRYQIVERLGHGGMGVVYRAYDPRIGRPVAIKLLRVTDEYLRQRFLQEAQSAGALKHPNIVTVYDFGEHEDQPFIVMELVEGTALSDIISKKFALSLIRKLELIEGLAAGLDYAHNRGVIHRDVKPANLMIDSDGVLKILDFGIARVAESGLTQVGMMMGTPNYMSPEQVDAGEIDRRSDVFAVGLVFYELLSYRQAFSGESLHTILNAIATGAPAPLRQIVPNLEPGLEVIVDRAIQKDPNQRYQTLAAFAADVIRVRQRLAVAHAASEAEDTISAESPPTPSGRRTPRGLNSQALASRRAAAIDAHLRVGRTAFEAGDYAGAIEAGEQAAMLDPNDARALDLLEQARRAFDDAQIAEWLSAARVRLERGALDEAGALIARALELDPASEDARRARATLLDIQAARQREAEHARAIQTALDLARTALANGDLEAAVRAASEVLVLEPRHSEARELGTRALTAIEERHRREEIERAAHDAVAAAKNEFAAGRWDTAIQRLEQVQPPHPIVAAALEDLRFERAEIQRRLAEERGRREREAREAEQRRQAEAAARARAEAERKRQVAELIGRARAALDLSRFDDAAAPLDQAAALDEGNPAVAELVARLEAERLAARRRAEHDAAATDLIARARALFAAGNRQQALDALTAFAPPHPTVSDALRALHAEAMELERRKREAEERRRQTEALRATLARGASAIAGNELDAAMRIADEALAIDAASIDAQAFRQRVQALVEQARTRLLHEQRVERTIRDARQRFGKGELDEALTLLQAFTPLDEAVAAELRSLREQARELKRRAAEALERQREEEARRREEEARQREEARRQEEVREREEAWRAEETRRCEEAQRLEEAARQREEAARQRDELERQRNEQTRALAGFADGAAIASTTEQPTEPVPLSVVTPPVTSEVATEWAERTTPIEPANEAVVTEVGPAVGIQRPFVSRRAVTIAGAAAALIVIAVAISRIGRSPVNDASPSTVPSATSMPPPSIANTTTAPVIAATTTTVAVPPTSTTSALAARAANGLLIIDAVPWAQVISVRDAADRAVTLTPSNFTPVAMSVPAGRYKVTLRDAGGSATETVTVDVEPAKEGKAFVEFRRIDAVEYFKKAGS